MNGFGKLLRSFRYRSCDTEHAERRLSQERLGELLGMELGGGYSGAAVSDWERGLSKIHADQRPVLVSLLKVLHRQGGVKTISDANELLDAGNYRALNPMERQQIFPEDPIDLIITPPLNSLRDHNWIISPILENLFSSSKEDMQILLMKAKEGPSPSWPRVLVALSNKLIARLTIFGILRALLWAWIFLLTWVSITPSIRIPFANTEVAKSAVILYVSGAIVIPLLIGIQTTTKDNAYWLHNNLASAPMTRLYTYQGASIGFHIGYFGVFFFRLLTYYMHLTLPIWVELAAMVLLLMSGYLAARLVPYNLWHAYGRLRLSDGGIFFISFLIGPIWGSLFLLIYPILLAPIIGLLTILLALSIYAALTAWQHHRTGTTIIPAHWWVILYGSIILFYQITLAKDLYSVISLAGLILAPAFLMARERLRITGRGALWLLVAVGLLLIAFWLNMWWIGVIIGGLSILAWMRWGKNLLSFPLSLFGIILAYIVCSWAFYTQRLSDISVSFTFGLVTLLVLLLEHRLVRD
jgi:hypothetical protein